MNNEQRAHDLTMFFLNKTCIPANNQSDNDFEIDMIKKYIKYYLIIREQLLELDD